MLDMDADCLVARLNRDLVEAEISLSQTTDDFGELKLAPVPVPTTSQLVGQCQSLPHLGGRWPGGPDEGAVGSKHRVARGTAVLASPSAIPNRTLARGGEGKDSRRARAIGHGHRK